MLIPKYSEEYTWTLNHDAKNVRIRIINADFLLWYEVDFLIIVTIGTVCGKMKPCHQPIQCGEVLRPGDFEFWKIKMKALMTQQANCSCGRLRRKYTPATMSRLWWFDFTWNKECMLQGGWRKAASGKDRWISQDCRWS